MFKKTIPTLLFAAAVLLGLPSDLAAASPASEPSYWQWAATPPMGWNSYDAWGSSVTEEVTLANAHYMQEHLQYPAPVPAHGAVLLRAVKDAPH